MARLVAGELISCGWILTRSRRFFSPEYQTQLHIEWVLGAFALRIKWLECETEYSLLSTAAARNEWRCAFTSLRYLHNVHLDNYNFYVGSLNCFKIACILYTSSHLLCLVTKSSIAFICCTLHSIRFLQNCILFSVPVLPWVVIFCNGRTQLWRQVFMDVGLFYGVSGTWCFMEWVVPDVSNRYNALQIFVITHPMTVSHPWRPESSTSLWELHTRYWVDLNKAVHWTCRVATY